MALFTVALVTEGCHPIVTSAAVETFFLIHMSHFCTIQHHINLKLCVAHFARVLPSMRPMGKIHWQDLVLG